MILQSEWTIRTGSPEETRLFGETLAEQLVQGSVVLLEGDLGTGKTTLTQGICHGLGVDDWANSPTFTLINEYVGRMPVFHCDFYRIDDPDELYNLALDPVFYGSGVALIEWPDIAQDWFPEGALWIQIERTGADERLFRLSGFERLESVPTA
jgi:tRNA threonylcarbamoyladenosine biosynthesis protein TsaE